PAPTTRMVGWLLVIVVRSQSNPSHLRPDGATTSATCAAPPYATSGRDCSGSRRSLVFGVAGHRGTAEQGGGRRRQEADGPPPEGVLERGGRGDGDGGDRRPIGDV